MPGEIVERWDLYGQERGNHSFIRRSYERLIGTLSDSFGSDLSDKEIIHYQQRSLETAIRMNLYLGGK